LIVVAPASHSQTRIWLKEQRHIHLNKPIVAIYNMPFIYKLSSQHTLSIKQFRQALHQVVIKHESLRTALIFNNKENLLMQRVINTSNNNNQLFTFIESIYETDQQLNEIMKNEKRNCELFDLAQGLVFRCHIVYYKQISSNDLVCDKDVIIFNSHHALFDIPSMDVFLHDLDQAYTTDQLPTNNDNALRYLDCKYRYFMNFSFITYCLSFFLDTVVEQQIPMTVANMFWLDTLHDCNLDRSLPLPYDRHHLSDGHRTGRGTSVSFDFGQDLSRDFFAYASSNNIALQHLSLACYYVFLFKLTNGEKDLCVGMDIANRYKEELKSVIGVFVNTIPLRCQLDPHWSFYQLVEHIQDMMTSSLEYSYFPLQRILDQHPKILKPSFLNISFDFHSTEVENFKNETMISDSRLYPMAIRMELGKDEIMTKFDFSLAVKHDLKTGQLSCTIAASLDVFDVETVNMITQRFHLILHQLFQSTIDHQMKKSVYEISLILSDENLLMQSMNNTEILFPSVSCIHHKFVYQSMKHPQKLAVELDDQSLTYCELLYYVQLLSLNLLETHGITPGEIICQCVERSLSMVSCL
jgi:hypothetical protein